MLKVRHKCGLRSKQWYKCIIYGFLFINRVKNTLKLQHGQEVLKVLRKKGKPKIHCSMTTEKAPTVDADCMIKSPHTSKLVDLEKNCCQLHFVWIFACVGGNTDTESQYSIDKFIPIKNVIHGKKCKRNHIPLFHLCLQQRVWNLPQTASYLYKVCRSEHTFAMIIKNCVSGLYSQLGFTRK